MSHEHHLPEEIFANVNQIADLIRPLHGIDETLCHTLVELFRNYDYDYAGGIIKIYFPFNINPEYVTQFTAVDSFDSVRLLKDGYRMVMHNSCHRRCFVGLLRNRMAWSGLQNYGACATYFGLT